MHRSLEWARYLGALPPKRMNASWSESTRTQPNTSMRRRLWRAMAGSPRFVLPSCTGRLCQDSRLARRSSRSLPTSTSVPRCSLWGRSGARHTRHARAKGAARGSAPPFPSVASRGPCIARSGRKSRFSVEPKSRMGKRNDLTEKAPYKFWPCLTTQMHGRPVQTCKSAPACSFLAPESDDQLRGSQNQPIGC